MTKISAKILPLVTELPDAKRKEILKAALNGDLAKIQDMLNTESGLIKAQSKTFGNQLIHYTVMSKKSDGSYEDLLFFLVFDHGVDIRSRNKERQRKNSRNGRRINIRTTKV